MRHFINSSFTLLTVNCSLLVLAAVGMTACEVDNYNKGQGRYSLIQGEFTELTVNSEKQGISFITDEGDTYTLTKPEEADWIETADTIYRAIIYFNKTDEGLANLYSMGRLATLSPREHWRFEQTPEDPVGVESIWLARNGKYINMGLLLKSGYVDDKEGLHAVALACDTVLTNTNQTRTAYYRLLHSQGDTPQHYTNRRFLSILVPEDRPDTIQLTIPTWSGPYTRHFALK